MSAKGNLSTLVGALRVILLGTGPSERVPRVTCLARPEISCKICKSAVTPQGRKNLRRNISALIQYKHIDGRTRNILLDCGKSFYNMSVELFPKIGVQSIDGLILTHNHQDAVGGLDDLREWTHLAQSTSGLPVYLRQCDYASIQSMMPWLCGKPCGSGFVAKLNFQPIADRPFEIDGIPIVPLECSHGADCTANGYLIGSQYAFITDADKVSDAVVDKIKHCHYLMLDMLWPEQFPLVTEFYDYSQLTRPSHVTATHARPRGHMSLPQSLQVAQRIKAAHTILIGANHRCDYGTISRALADYSRGNGLLVEMGYDGMELPPISIN